MQMNFFICPRELVASKQNRIWKFFFDGKFPSH